MLVSWKEKIDQDGLEGLLQSIVQLPSSGDANVATRAAGILSNLACSSKRNEVGRLQGADALVRTVPNAGDGEEIAVCTRRRLTSRHVESEMAKNAVRRNYGRVAPSTLAFGEGCDRTGVCNLALCMPLREYGAMHRLVRLLLRAFQDTQRVQDVASGADGALEEGQNANITRVFALSRAIPRHFYLLMRDYYMAPV